MRKPDFCLCKNKGQISFVVTAQLMSAFVFATGIVQSLPLLNPKFQASSFFSVAVRAGFCQTWSETPKTGFLASWLNSDCMSNSSLTTSNFS